MRKTNVHLQQLCTSCLVIDQLMISMIINGELFEHDWTRDLLLNKHILWWRQKTFFLLSIWYFFFSREYDLRYPKRRDEVPICQVISRNLWLSSPFEVGGAVNNSKGLHSVPTGAPFNYHFNLRIYENVHAECLP